MITESEFAALTGQITASLAAQWFPKKRNIDPVDAATLTRTAAALAGAVVESAHIAYPTVAKLGKSYVER